MDTQSYKTVYANPKTVTKGWVVIDATDLVLGRLASRVALILRGKDKPYFTPNQDCGDNVIIVNADKVIFTGKKMTDKKYLTFSGYPGGQHSATPAEMAKRPHGYERMVRHAVKGMLPKGNLGAKLLDNLYIYAGGEHKHEAQSPKTIDINTLK